MSRLSFFRWPFSRSISFGRFSAPGVSPSYFLRHKLTHLSLSSYVRAVSCREYHAQLGSGRPSGPDPKRTG